MKNSLLSILPALVLALSSQAVAQQAARGVPSRVPVTIAMVETLPGAGYALQRRPGGAQHDVLLVRRDLTGPQFNDALRAVMTIRQIDGDTSTRATTVRPHSSRADRGRASGREFPWASRVLADLRRAQRKQVQGVGSVPAVEVWLPPQRSKAARR